MAVNNIILRVTSGSQNYDLEVDNQIPLRLDVSALESQNIGKVFGIGSQNFTLRGTQQNSLFFKHGYDVSIDDVPSMYNTLPVSVLLNGDTVLDGQLQLVNAISSDDGYVAYEVSVTDTTIEFEQALQSKLIKDADWSAYNHTFTSQSIINSWTDGLLSGSVYYPVCHYGYPNGDSTNYPQLALTPSGSNVGSFINNSFTPMQTTQFLPAIKLKDTLDVIFDQVDFRYTGSFTETADFNKLYVLNKQNEGLGIVASGSTEPTFFANQTQAQTYQMESSSNQWRRVQYNNTVSDPTSAYTAECINTSDLSTGSKYTTPASGEYTFDANISAFNPLWATAGVTGVCKISLMKGSLPCGASGGSGTVIATDEVTLDQAYGFNTFALEINATDTLSVGQDVWVWVEWYATAGSPSSPANDLQLGYFQNYFRCTAAPVSYEGVTVNMANQWNPNTKSIDIVKGILEQFNLVMYPQEGNSSTIVIEQFDDWVRAGEIKDWTYRYDTAKRIGVTHTVDELASQLTLKNVDDVDRFSKASIDSVPNLQYGSLRLLAGNNISQGETEVGEYFAPTVLGGSTVYSLSSTVDTNLIDLDTNFVYPHLYKYDNDKLTSYAFKPRIGYKVNNPLTSDQYFYIGQYQQSIQVSGSYATLANVSDLPVTASVSNDLHFNNTYTKFTNNSTLNLGDAKSNYTNYYETYLDSLYWQGSRKVTLDLYFEPSEYKQIKLNDIILIKGQAFRINKISGFNLTARDVVTVELIKLYPEYWSLGGAGASPPSDIFNGWEFTAGTVNIAGTDQIGFHRGTLLTNNSCDPSTLGFGAGSGSTTTQINLPGTDCYVFTVLGSDIYSKKGYGIQGAGTAVGYALTQFYSEVSASVLVKNVMAVTDSDGTSGNVGSGTFNVQITGSNGDLGTATIGYVAGGSYVDNNGSGSSVTPESLSSGSGGFEFTITPAVGLTNGLTNGVNYRVKLV